MQFINQIWEWMQANGGIIASVLGGIIMVAKMFSNDKAGPVIKAVQAFVDGLAKIFVVIGNILAFISDLLANALKSDGFLGKK